MDASSVLPPNLVSVRTSGRYSLKLIEADRNGASVGNHRVQVSLPTESSGRFLRTYLNVRTSQGLEVSP